MKEERFPHTRKPLCGRRLQRGEALGATEERAATGVRRAKRRDSRTEDRCLPALTSQRGLSAHVLRLRLQGQIPGEDWGWLCEHSLKELVHHS